MTEKEKEIIENAMRILHNEGYKGQYDGNEANIFWEAEERIQKALDKAKPE